MNQTSRRVLIILALITAAVGVVTATGSAASTRRGPQRFVLYSANIENKDAPLLVQATGQITAIGPATSSDDATGNTVPLTFSFPKGKLFVKAHVTFSWRPDLTTCTATRHGTGTYTITGGTGSYRRMTSHGIYVERGAAIGARDNNGRCQQKFKLNYVVANLTSN
jgi:hypothetical protein